MAENFYDKTQFLVIGLTLITGVSGILILRKLKINPLDYKLNDEQSDRLVMGVFHLLISVISILFIV
ncbi:hypothetical protein GCM10023149_39640 [Mucilaginibacter gynuensis]|uniref:Uncharacterized protein n=1 Tax=Mucilaginibacter gynuensis TaxID=1302236 RepID=A0ABP8H1L7_9SPHI